MRSGSRVFQASSAAWTFWRAVSSVNGGSGGRGFMSVFMFQLGFEFGNASFERRNQFLSFLVGVTCRDVFGAIPVERDDFNEEQTLHNPLNVRLGQLLDEFRVLPGILNACVAEDFETRALRVVHE